MSYLHEGKFFAYLQERDSVRLRKAQGLPFPWTDDPILQRYSFTNVFREHDRTTVGLNESFYRENANAPMRDILMNATMFRFFGRLEFCQAVGWQIQKAFDFEHVRRTAKQWKQEGKTVFTGAYNISNQGKRLPKEDVILDHVLKPLQSAICNGLLDVARETQSWQEFSKALCKQNGFKEFMAKEVMLDTMLTWFWDDRKFLHSYPKDYMKWTPIGPGAIRGACRVVDGVRREGQILLVNGMSEDRVRAIILDLMERCPLIDHRKLSPTDIQFGLCEFDKYQRAQDGHKLKKRYHPRLLPLV